MNLNWIIVHGFDFNDQITLTLQNRTESFGGQFTNQLQLIDAVGLIVDTVLHSIAVAGKPASNALIKESIGMVQQLQTKIWELDAGKHLRLTLPLYIDEIKKQQIVFCVSIIAFASDDILNKALWNGIPLKNDVKAYARIKSST